MTQLKKSTLIKNWLLTYSSETCYNYERMQGLGNTNAFVPVIRELYPRERQAEELKKYLVFYNTEPSWMGTIINGISSAMEEKRANGAQISADDITVLRAALMGPMAGIGDTVSQSIAYPVLAGICIQLALAGNFAGPILFETVFKILMLTCGYNMFMLGYRKGKDAIVELLSSGIINRILNAVSVVGLMVVGAMTVQNVHLDLSFAQFTWSNELGDVKFNLQKGVFDALLPGLLPMLVVLGVWFLLRKKVKPLYLVLIIFGLGFLIVGLEALCGAYA
ncbi:PTS system mannose/fructose/sorbose family IID component [Coriobacterium glomerans PW2]|uniref:PTS system mannose/fructose/sorbose family IID component n=1 Tax=Coriobacterium glomerans (strain ATCC 49209 / DSM 20642 / JCM 10262 / PW2) TaxID=700015 RepID=F2N8F1_CORGP|nr:PTS system mannose/fructose/sorbose family transporter subunit IID [Coriobacterium glomerans]AEB07334.1 PTS system mannose/fructose/sorbose family IID component [Coriobacterium glomerans PW2]